MGKTDEWIKNEMGGVDEINKMGNIRQSQLLGDIIKAQKLDSAKANRAAKSIDRMGSRAKYNEAGEPTNGAAHAMNIRQVLLGQDPDPESTGTINDYLTPSERKRLNGLYSDAGRGKVSPTALKRAQQILESAKGRAEKAWKAKQYKTEVNDKANNLKLRMDQEARLIDKAFQTAQTAADKARFKEKQAKLGNLTKRFSAVSRLLGLELKKDPNKQDQKMLDKYTAELNDITEAMNPPAEGKPAENAVKQPYIKNDKNRKLTNKFAASLPPDMSDEDKANAVRNYLKNSDELDRG
jgi:hypothetical protein